MYILCPYCQFILFLDENRSNLLLCRSFLRARNLTAATVVIPKELVDRGLQAHSEFVAFESKKKQEKEAKELAKKSEEEAARILKETQKDEERRSKLAKLRLMEKDAHEKKKEAARQTTEAERNLHTAMDALKAAHAEEEKASMCISDFSSKKLM